jgi:AcrR family transcriptional regulator
MEQELTRGRGRPRDASIDAAILDATVEELIERGFIGLSMEAVAARAGVAKTTLYRRWPGTQELALEAMRSLVVKPAGEPPAGSARDGLLFLLDRMRGTWADPRFAALMRRVAADGTSQPEVYRSCRDRLIRPQIAAMNRELGRAVDEGLIRADADLDWVRQLITSPILAAAMTHRERVTRAQVEYTLDTVLRGVAP